MRDNVRAGYVYLVMASFGTLALLLAFGLLAGPDGGYAFAAIRAAHPSRRLSPRWCLILALLGAGSKAGLVPLHVWLPLAHPAAPSHVSALMSGVMTKVAVYGFVRIVFDLLGPPAWWWSMVVLALGGITAVLGVLYALMQHDLKRLLAYHTVENIGIIFIGLGLALAFEANGMRAARRRWRSPPRCSTSSTIRCSRACCSSAPAPCSTATGERDMEHLGGLIHRMPQTAFAVPGRLRRDLGAAAAQRLRLRVADLPGDPAEPGAAAMGPEAHGAGGRRAAGAVGGARRRLLRQGLRRHLPRPAAHARRRDGAHEADRCSLAAMFVSRRAVPARRHPAGPRHRRARAGGRRRSSAAACRRRPASPWLSIVPIAESRSSYNGLLVFLFIAVSALARGLWPSTASPRDAAAPRAGLGLRLSRCRARRRNTRPAASRSRSAACSAPSSFARASRSTCRRPATRGPARLDRRAARPRSGTTLYAPIAGGVDVRRRPAQPPAVPDHPPVSQPRLRRARRSCSWCSRYGPDPRPRRAGRADAAGAAAGAAADRLRAQGQGAAAAPAGAAAAPALSRPRCGCCARRSCWRRTPPGCSASRPT